MSKKQHSSTNHQGRLLILFVIILRSTSETGELHNLEHFCKKPPRFIQNGHIDFYGAVRLECCGYLGEIRFGCNLGYTLVGNETIVCTGGQWTDPPYCEAQNRCSVSGLITQIDHAESVEEQLLVNERNISAILPGSFIQFTCKQNFRHLTTSGPLRITCESDGTWTRKPQCILERAVCDQSKFRTPIFAHTIKEDLTPFDDSLQSYVEGSYVIYECDDLYMNPFEEPLKIECLSNGSWSQHIGCQMKPNHPYLLRCNDEPPIDFVQTTILGHKLFKYEDGKFDGYYQFKCKDEDKEPIDSLDTVVCNNGQWIGRPICKGQLYEILPKYDSYHIIKIQLHGTKRNQDAIKIGSSIEIKCILPLVHDQSTGQLLIECLSNGQWTPGPKCIALNTTTVLKPIPMALRGRYHGRRRPYKSKRKIKRLRHRKLNTPFLVKNNSYGESVRRHLRDDCEPGTENCTRPESTLNKTTVQMDHEFSRASDLATQFNSIMATNAIENDTETNFTLISEHEPDLYTETVKVSTDNKLVPSEYHSSTVDCLLMTETKFISTDDNGQNQPEFKLVHDFSTKDPDKSSSEPIEIATTKEMDAQFVMTNYSSTIFIEPLITENDGISTNYILNNANLSTEFECNDEATDLTDQYKTNSESLIGATILPTTNATDSNDVKIISIEAETLTHQTEIEEVENFSTGSFVGTLLMQEEFTSETFEPAETFIQSEKTQ
ncbi:hypothetical protein ACOME3_005415 [Neoechinorhynchus agilis]